MKKRKRKTKIKKRGKYEKEKKGIGKKIINIKKIKCERRIKKEEKKE